MKKIKLLRLMSLMALMLCMSLPSLAGGSSTYYSKVVATAVGDGKVYASKSTTSSPSYVAGSSSATNSGSSSSHTYYVYAQANDGNEFAGWYENEACTGDPVSTASPYTVKVTANSTNSSSPTTKNLYAKFVPVGAPTLVYSDTHVYANLSSDTYKNESLTTENVVDEITYSSSNENVATVAADGTVTLIKNGSCYITAKSGEGEGSYILTVIDDLSAGKTQIGNGDFENWSTVTSSNHAPYNWNSFETAEGSLVSMVSAQQVAMFEGGRPGSDGFYCADIYSRNVMFGIIAQGNLTTGCIYAHSTTAGENYNFSKTEDESKSETLSEIPTAIRFWGKFVQGKTNTSHPNARVTAVVHDSHNYITYGQASDDNDENKSYVIAQAQKDFPACDWTEFTLPLEMECNPVNGRFYIIVNFSTNAEPAQGQEGDHLYIDDVELLYEKEFDEVPVTKSEARYGTFCAPMDVNVPYGKKAYTVNGLKEDNLTLDLTEVTGTIPANTPVILEGEGELNLTVYGKAAPAIAEAGLLTGVYENTPAPVGSYVLQDIDEKLGFYLVAEGKQPTVTANHAYLTAPDASGVKALFLSDDDATGLEMNNAQMYDVQAPIFNIAGQRIGKMQKGINIVNGKKVFIK